ncbi:O-methylsterigmatocystin oxidoreductase [Coprinopsis sp. MPI-PUGE-AT-0042]|nr:O-methylsterigmatocystin oxidoreductase [Coprinopsis sp. MPI-PUGE-AT-0042]
MNVITTTSSLSVLIPLIVILLHQLFGRKKINAPKPPGPKGLPLLGNLLQMPSPSGKEAPWRVFSQWREKYGELHMDHVLETDRLNSVYRSTGGLVYLNVAGQKFLVLNSFSAVDELLNKRATNYSERISSPINTLTRHTWDFVVSNYTPQWRDHRRSFHQFFNQNHIQQVLRPVIDEEVPKFLKSLINRPTKHEEALRSFFGTIIIRLSYGTSSSDEERNRYLIESSDELVQEQALAYQPARYWVGLMPWLQYVPAWAPGAGWKRRLEHLACLNDRLIEEPFEMVKARLSAGTLVNDLEPTPNIATHLLEKLPEATHEEFEYRRNIAKHVSAISYIAGADTTRSSALALLLALAMHPEVQRKAQACIDAELGEEAGSRLPTWMDLERIPYISAILREVGRWHTVLPFAFPHVSKEDDIYKGYHIPANTTILPNTWAIMHDPATFEDPFAFKPERYLKKDGKINPKILGPEDGSFGYGRRICPGRHLSNESLSIMVVSLLSCFDILSAVDEAGCPKPLELKVTSSTMSVPAPFEIIMKPRSQQHEDLIRGL